MFEKFKNLFKKKNKINPQILVGQNLDDAHIGLLSGANSQNVDNVEIESNENVEINPKELEEKSLDDIEFSQLNKENTNSEYKEQEIIDIALERVGNPFANCDLGPMTSESYVKWKSLIIEEILLDKSLSDGLSKEDIEQLLDVVYGEKAKGTFVELYVGRLTKSKFQLLKNQYLEDKNLNREFNPQVVCIPNFENCNFNGVELKNINDVVINPSSLVGKSLEGVDLSVVDTENYPQNIPDKATCEILDELLSEDKLTFREVKYCVRNNGISLTKPYMECSFDGRKFVRVEVKNDNNPDLNVGEYSWIEVQPISEKTNFVGMTEGLDGSNTIDYLNDYFNMHIDESQEEKGKNR